MSTSTRTTRQPATTSGDGALPRRRSSSKSSRGWKGVSAGAAFLIVGSIAVLTLGAGYVLGLPFAWLPGVGAAVIAWALWRSDRKGFIRSRQMRRAHEPQRHFSPGMVFVLSGLFVVNVLACFYIWLTAS